VGDARGLPVVKPSERNPSERFAELVHRPEAQLSLDEAALTIAAHARPDLDVAAELGQLDALATKCPEPSLDGLRRYLFEELGFHGNTDDYADPSNSFLDEVVRRRTGLPITLSVVLIEVGRRLDVPLVGVGMPGHFLVRHERPPGEFIDAFDGGRVLDEDGCCRRFHTVMGADAIFRSSYLDAVGPRAILTRILANLRRLYATRGQLDDAAWVSGLQLLIPGNPSRN
jgi:regulator of sirC expression with transglutaminase-like and TPR domain